MLPPAQQASGARPGCALKTRRARRGPACKRLAPGARLPARSTGRDGHARWRRSAHTAAAIRSTSQNEPARGGPPLTTQVPASHAERLCLLEEKPCGQQRGKSFVRPHQKGSPEIAHLPRQQLNQILNRPTELCVYDAATLLAAATIAIRASMTAEPPPSQRPKEHRRTE